MIKEIVKDRDFLSKPAEPATADDAEVVQDLRDTIEALEDCVCLAANQIGSTKAIIAYEDNGRTFVMYNPHLESGLQRFSTVEECLSLDEPSVVERFKMIRVSYEVFAGGKLEKRTVTVGTFDETYNTYEILDGLAAEDYIAFPEDGMEEGDPTTHTMPTEDPSAEPSDGVDDSGTIGDGVDDSGAIGDSADTGPIEGGEEESAGSEDGESSQTGGVTYAR